MTEYSTTSISSKTWEAPPDPEPPVGRGDGWELVCSTVLGNADDSDSVFFYWTWKRGTK